jgi:GNAT superfamily N-acetyltransferase
VPAFRQLRLALKLNLKARISHEFASVRVLKTIRTNMKEVADFQIRLARVEDVPIILELIRDLATYERAPHEVTATEEQLVGVLFGERPAAEVLLAFEGESPVGFAVYFYNFSTWLGRPGLYLEDLFVKPEKRGKGYGRALLVELAKIARDHGCGRMEWAVLNWNEPAIKFYRALGAKPMDEWTVFRLTPEEIAKLADAADTAATIEHPPLLRLRRGSSRFAGEE